MRHCHDARWIHLGLCLSLLLDAVPAAAAVKLELRDDAVIGLGLLLQPQVRVTEGGAADGEGASFDPLVRRVRIMLDGKLGERVYFFAETDQPNFGLRGDWNAPLFMQDAWVELNLHTALQLDVGMFSVPFTHHGAQGATSLLLTDYHLSILKYPREANKVLRDVGVMARGELLGHLLDYRISITNGVQSRRDASPVGDTERNRRDAPWVNARVSLNLFDSEVGPGVAGFFLDGLYLQEVAGQLKSPKRILSFGMSASWQSQAVLNRSRPHDFTGTALDVFADLPVGDGTEAFTGQLVLVGYHLGRSNVDTGYGGMLELGYRWQRWQPVLGVDWYRSDPGPFDELVALRGGVNWWLQGHAANLKLELGAVHQESAEDAWVAQGQAQVQLLF
jgi:hypothetical protein